MKIKKLNEDIQHCWFGYYLDIKGNKKYFYMTKDSTSNDADEASEIMEDSIPEPFTKFVFQGSVANTQAEKQGMKLVESKKLEETLDNQDLGLIQRTVEKEIDYLKSELNTKLDKNTNLLVDQHKAIYQTMQNTSKKESFSESKESEESELITKYINNGEFDKLEKVKDGTNVIWKLKEPINSIDESKSIKESKATHCVYFSLDGGKTQEIEFEGTEDECQHYIEKQEADNEFGDEAPERFVKRLTESLSPREGDRVQMDFYAKDNNGATGTCTGRIGELCFIEWDDGTKSKEIKGYLKVIERPNMNEASYGGAFDIADDQYFTRDDIESAAEEVLNHINETFTEQYKLGGTWFEDGRWIVNVKSIDGDWEFEELLPIDMRKIKEPWHLKREYAFDMASKFINKIKLEVHPITESLNEDTDTVAVEGPKEGPEAGLSSLINEAIQDELKTIDIYNSLAITARSEGYEDIAKMVDEINTEENKHVGQLQEALKSISPNAVAIEDGTAEGQEQLSNMLLIDDDLTDDELGMALFKLR